LASLWLIPPDDLATELSSIIARLSDRFSTPRFQPHVTFISRLSGSADGMRSRTADLATRLRPFDVYLTTLGYTNDYFRALFIAVDQTEPLMEAQATARRLFKQSSDQPYQPHLSLLYGHLDNSIKEAIIAEIGRDFRRTFRVTHLYLVSSEGEPAEWRHLGEFSLGSTPTRHDDL
jgi:2'-5' RNA ligase